MLKSQFDVASLADQATRQASDGRVPLDSLFLKRLRQKRGLSQDALADACSDSRLCLSLASIKRAEAGKPVLYRTARHLAAFFGTELELLVATTAAEPGKAIIMPNIENRRAVRTRGFDRRCVVPSVIYFTVNRCDLNDTAHTQLMDSGARTMPNPAGTELAIVFGAPAHRSSDAFSALQCAVKLQTCSTSAGSVILRRCTMADVFGDSPITGSLVKHTSSIFLETSLATQLATIAQFELGDNQLPGCRRFVRFNGAQS